MTLDRVIELKDLKELPDGLMIANSPLTIEGAQKWAEDKKSWTVYYWAETKMAFIPVLESNK